MSFKKLKFNTYLVLDTALYLVCRAFDLLYFILHHTAAYVRVATFYVEDVRVNAQARGYKHLED